jgi:probable addiction module antidote protein
MPTTPTKEKVQTRPFDAAKYLDDAESQALLISNALETGNRDYILRAINTVARARGMSELARQTGLQRGTLYAALDEGANPTLETLLQVLNALGVSLKADVREPEHA